MIHLLTTTEARNGACAADTTDPCTALVMADAYNGNGILFDHCSRREVVDPFVYYTRDILAGHIHSVTQRDRECIKILLSLVYI